MSVMMQEGAPRNSYTREVPLNVTLYGCAVGLLSFLIIWLGVLCFVPRDAYAFEVNGEYYPDSLGGITVTMNSHLIDPAGASFTDQWQRLLIRTMDAPSSAPSGNAGYSEWAYFETSALATGDPWYWYVSWTNSFDANAAYPSNPYLTNVTYWARYGYDGASNVAAWWGLRSSVSRPTVYFINAPRNATPLLYDQEFIMWVVLNSDYRTRYGGGSSAPWQNPVISQSGKNFGWSMNENNPSSTLTIQRLTSSSLNGPESWENVDFRNPSPYVGSFVATQSGQYRFVWNYTFQGGSYVYTSNVYSVVLETSTSLGFQSVDIRSVSDGSVYITAYLTGDPDSVVIQHEVNGTWETFGTFIGGVTLSGGYSWTWHGPTIDGDSYRLLATQSDPSDSATYDLGNNVNQHSFNPIGYVSSLTTWITQLILVIPDFFLWMPTEIRSVLISVIIVMIVLGLVGWLKS